MIPSKIGKIDRYINDFSAVLSKEKLGELDIHFQKIEQKTGKQIVTVIFPSREGFELKDIGIEIFNTLGIGQKKLNNGLLLLIASEEKKIRIVVGKGLEWIYDDAWCQELIEKNLRPLLSTNNFETLEEVFYDAIQKKEISTLQGQNTTEKSNFLSLFQVTRSTQKSTRNRPNMIHILLGFLFCIIPPFFFYPSLIEKFGFLSVCVIIIFFLLGLFTLFLKKKKSIGFFILISAIILFQLLISGLIHQQRVECQKDPILCEQRRIENEQRNDSYQSSSSYESPSSSYDSHSSFGGGGGSTNGAGWGD